MLHKQHVFFPTGRLCTKLLEELLDFGGRAAATSPLPELEDLFPATAAPPLPWRPGWLVC